MVKWAVDVTRAEDLPRILHRAAKVALTPPTGPVFISLPGDVLDQEVELDMGKPGARRCRDPAVGRDAGAARRRCCSPRTAR